MFDVQCSVAVMWGPARSPSPFNIPIKSDISNNVSIPGPILQLQVELETKAIRRFAKVSIVSYSRLSLMIIASASQFHIYLSWGQRQFSIVS